jgi:hypothetical protein
MLVPLVIFVVDDFVRTMCMDFILCSDIYLMVLTHGCASFFLFPFSQGTRLGTSEPKGCFSKISVNLMQLFSLQNILVRFIRCVKKLNGSINNLCVMFVCA